MTFSIKLDEYYDCVLKIVLSTKITSSEFIENMCHFHFQMQACAHVVICGSNENYFGQCFPLKFPLLHFTCMYRNYETKSYF